MKGGPSLHSRRAGSDYPMHYSTTDTGCKRGKNGEEGRKEEREEGKTGIRPLMRASVPTFFRSSSFPSFPRLSLRFPPIYLGALQTAGEVDEDGLPLGEDI